ncbi:hypothetical protein [Dasania marina]|uniref:hypothetical protein n=1 Tax=Dasania marina TaxID=471499 RepID=UPI0012EA573F|nr:hypothetical protein [Dasania marina]
MNELEEAEVTVRKAVKIMVNLTREDRAKLLSIISMLYYFINDPEQAIFYAGEAQKYAPIHGSPGVMSTLAGAFMQFEMYEKAREILLKVIEVNKDAPKHPYYLQMYNALMEKDLTRGHI